MFEGEISMHKGQHGSAQVLADEEVVWGDVWCAYSEGMVINQRMYRSILVT